MLAARTSSGVSLLRLKCWARPGKYCSTPAGVEMFRSGLTFLNLTDTADSAAGAVQPS